jgi:hypothetical protein
VGAGDQAVRRKNRVNRQGARNTKIKSRSIA